MAATLKGVAAFMTEYDSFRVMEFQIWSLSATTRELTKIGSGAVGGSTRSVGVGEGDEVEGGEGERERERVGLERGRGTS